MDLTDQEREALKKGFLIEGFFEALLKLLGMKRDSYARRIHASPKKAMDEQAMHLLLGNGGCLALNDFEREIEQLHKLALSERPEPLNQA